MNPMNVGSEEVITTNRFKLLDNDENINDINYVTMNKNKKITQERKPAQLLENSNQKNDFSLPSL